MSEAIIDLKNIRLRRGGKEILDNVSWQMRRGEHWAVIGANGSGKTTLLQIAGGCLFPTGGEATVLGGRFGACDLLQLRRRIGWVSSALQSRMPGTETAREIVVSGLRATFGIVYQYSAADTSLAESRLAAVGLADRADAPFGVLSQGEQQKTLFARARMNHPELLILDEPCGGLDLAARESFLRVVDETAAAGGEAVVMVTHHIEEIPPSLTHALVLRGGRVLAAGPLAETLTPAIMSEAFGIPVEVERHHDRYWARVGRRPERR